MMMDKVERTKTIQSGDIVVTFPSGEAMKTIAKIFGCKEEETAEILASFTVTQQKKKQKTEEKCMLHGK